MQANIGDRDQMRHSAASGLGLHYLPTSNKKDARLILEKVTSNRLEKSVKEFQLLVYKGRRLSTTPQFLYVLLSCQPRVTVWLYFVYNC